MDAGHQLYHEVNKALVMVQAIRTVGCIVLACHGIDCWRNSWTYSSGGPCYDYITLTHWPLGNFKWNFRLVIFKLNLVNGGWGISYEIALRWMSLDLTDDKSTLVQVMAWCRQASCNMATMKWAWCQVGACAFTMQWSGTRSVHCH